MKRVNRKLLETHISILDSTFSYSEERYTKSKTLQETQTNLRNPLKL